MRLSVYLALENRAVDHFSKPKGLNFLFSIVFLTKNDNILTKIGIMIYKNIKMCSVGDFIQAVVAKMKLSAPGKLFGS